MTDEPSQPASGCAVLMLDERVLQDFLKLPDGVRVVGIYPDMARRAIGIFLEGPGLPLCERGELPHLIWPTVVMVYWPTANGPGQTVVERLSFTMPGEAMAGGRVVHDDDESNR